MREKFENGFEDKSQKPSVNTLQIYSGLASTVVSNAAMASL